MKKLIGTSITAPIPIVGYLVVGGSVGAFSNPCFVGIQILESQFAWWALGLSVLTLAVAIVEITRGERPSGARLDYTVVLGPAPHISIDAIPTDEVLGRVTGIRRAVCFKSTAVGNLKWVNPLRKMRCRVIQHLGDVVLYLGKVGVGAAGISLYSLIATPKSGNKHA